MRAAPLSPADRARDARLVPPSPGTRETRGPIPADAFHLGPKTRPAEQEPVLRPALALQGEIAIGGIVGLRRELELVEQTLAKANPTDRADRAALWAVRSELRKLRLLDQFRNRLIGG